MKLSFDKQYAAVGLCIGTVWAYYTYNFFNYFVDDAYISLIYARNLLLGEGLTWSGERVEGYTNFLFIILCAALHFITGIALPLCTRLINASAFLGILYIVWNYAKILTRSQPDTKYVKFLALLAVGFSLPLAAFVFAGLESVFFAFLCTVPVIWLLVFAHTGNFTHKNALVMGIVLSLATLTRPEGLLIAALTGGTLLILGVHPLRDFKKILSLALPYLIIFGCYAAWKYHYFGDILPNTYYAKATHIPAEIRQQKGALYLIKDLLRFPLYTFYAVFFLAYFALTRELHKRHVIIFAWMLVYAIYAYSVGVDYMSYSRFIMPIIVWEILLILEILFTLFSVRGKKVGGEFFWLFAVCAMLQPLQILPFNEDLSVINGKARQPIFENHLPKGSVIALNAAGYLPYHLPQFQYIDMLGLNNSHIAKTAGIYDPRALNMIGHQKADAAYVLFRKPDVIILSTSEYKLRHASDFQMVEQKQFQENYRRLEHRVTPLPKYIPVLKDSKGLNADGTVKLVFYVHKDAAQYFAGYKTTPIDPSLFSGQQ